MKYSKLILFTLVAVVITDAMRYLSWVGAASSNNTTAISSILTYVSIFIMIAFAFSSKWNNDVPQTIKGLYQIWLFWIILNLIRGAFLASDYWDWKMLVLGSLFFSLIPLVFFFGKNLAIVQFVFRLVFKYLFLLGFLFIPLTLTTNAELYSRLMIPISLFILFIPYLKFKWKLLVIIVAVTSILMVIGFRSNIIKIAFSVLLLFVYYFRKFIHLNLLRVTHLFLFVVPFFLLYLASTDKYNIFSDISSNEGYNATDKQGNRENLMTDTRTFLYAEVLSSMKESGNWLIGESAVGSYHSDWFTDTGGAMNGKRYGSEVGILNILLRYGIVGVLIYFLLLLKVSTIAIKYSSNSLARMLGLFIAFRWTFSFVEEFTQYDLNFYIFWLAIGLVSSTRFRNMNDNEIREFLQLQ